MIFVAYSFSVTTPNTVQNSFSVSESVDVANEMCKQFCGGIFSTFLAAEELVILVLFWAISHVFVYLWELDPRRCGLVANPNI